MKLVYPAIFSPLESKEGYCVVVPDLPGCLTEGDNLAQAIEMAIDAASGWVLDDLEDGQQPPAASPLHEIKLNEENEFVSLIVLDMESYAEKYGDKAVRKNLTIPAWLATIADKEKINYSQVLQSALISELQLQK